MTAESSRGREHFATSRAADFLEPRSLEASTGVPRRRFAEIVSKELLDNGIDAAESAGRRPVVSIDATAEDDGLTIAVSDNGDGIPADVVSKVLDFDHLISDKARYRSPTRGQQGNALKTVVGVSSVLGGRPVFIDAGGVRHAVRAELVGGHVVTGHDRADGTGRDGTTVTVTVDAAEQEIDLWRLVTGFALANPHVRVDVSVDERFSMLTGCAAGSGSYTPTAPESWSKYQPGDFGSPHWYDGDAMAGLVLAYGAMPEPPPLGSFIRQFTGLSGTAAAKDVTAGLLANKKAAFAGWPPCVTTLADLIADRERIPDLLYAMRSRARAPKPAGLGPVGEDHLRHVINASYDINGRYWYGQKTAVVGGVPWLIEAFVAETADGGDVHYALNHSPMVGDPLSRAYLSGGDLYSYGLGGLLTRAGVDAETHAAAVHIVSPAPTFLDRGKTSLAVPPDVATAAAAAVWQVAKTIHKEAKRHRATETRALKAARQAGEADKPARVTLRDAVSMVMRQAYGQVSGDGEYPFDCRSLYYKVRPLIQQHTMADLDYDYFSTLLPEYQREHGGLSGLYYESRGWLYEPHGGRAVPLGTREVADYTAPKWLFDKLLYVEKEGLWPVLQAARLGERHDMAIMAGKGYASEAARMLAARVQRDNRFRVFVLHDGDPAGYNIGRTFAEETARMPDHSVEVVDLGLTVADAIDREMETESFTRTKALPGKLTLDERELAWFEGERIQGGGRPSWRCTRVELNAFSSPDLIAYIEVGLAAHGADTKVVPPEPVLAQEASLMLRGQLSGRVDDLIAEALDRDAILSALVAEFAAAPPVGLTENVADLHQRDRTQPWVAAVEDRVAGELDDADDLIRERFGDLLADQLDGGAS